MKLIRYALSALFLTLSVAFAQVDTSELTITSQDTSYPAYLAAPSSDGAKPAVVLMHSINGLEEGYLALSDQLAAEGFVVLTLSWQEYEREPALDVLDQLLRDSVAYLRIRTDGELLQPYPRHRGVIRLPLHSVSPGESLDDLSYARVHIFVPTRYILVDSLTHAN